MAVHNAKSGKCSTKGGGFQGLEKLLSEIDDLIEDGKEMLCGPKPDCGVTIEEYAEFIGRSNTTAARRLNARVKAGKMKVVKWHNGTCGLNVYTIA